MVIILVAHVPGITTIGGDPDAVKAGLIRGANSDRLVRRKGIGVMARSFCNTAMERSTVYQEVCIPQYYTGRSQ